MQAQKQLSRLVQRPHPADTDQLCEYVRDNSDRYFGDLIEGPVQVRLARAQRRKMSAVFEFEVCGGQWRRSVIAKVHRARPHDANVNGAPEQSPQDRPRLAPWISRETSARMEYQALRALHAHFTQLGDARFVSVRPLDLLEDGAVIVTEKLPLKNLKDLFIRHHRLDRAADETNILQAFHNAGAWLRELHRLPPLPHTSTRHTQRHDFVQSVQAFTEFLAATHGNMPFFRSIASLVEERASDVLPEQLPLGMLHGDYGPRNLLADSDGTVAGFDTRARCYGPIYEDLGYFRAMLHKDSPELYGVRFCYPAKWTDRLGEEFLRGYFAGTAIPRQTIQLFEIQASLEKWAPYTLGYREAKGVRRFAKRCRLEMLSQFFFRRLRRLAAELRSPVYPSFTGARHVATTEIC